jgi:hypothetical protein
MQLRVMFRGDDRHPVEGGIFASGFTKWDPLRPAPFYRRRTDLPVAGDLDPESGVCVSARFEAAAMFPLKRDAGSARLISFIYVVLVDFETLLNTHGLQVRDALGERARRRVGGRVTTQWRNEGAGYNAAHTPGLSPMWPLFAHELAADSIPAGQVISAIRCTRTWTGEDWTRGGSYTLGNTFHNPGCTAPQVFVSAARSFLGREFVNHRTKDMPGGLGGYSLANLR